MRLTREQMLQEMGLGPIWRQREPGWGIVQPDQRANPPTAKSSPIEAHPRVQTDPVTQPATVIRPPEPLGPVDTLNWPELAEKVARCQTCALCQHRNQAVFGVGDTEADWLFIGEGPGAEEDAKGEPFVGQAGKLLDNMLAAIDLKRGENVYIANAVKCRPPGTGHRNPLKWRRVAPIWNARLP